MSLAINVSTAEGMALAADSRQSYRNKKGQARVGSDSASKLFKLSDRVGLTTTGPAFLLEGKELKNISKFIDDFKRNEKIENLTIKEIAKKLHDFFEEKYHYQDLVKKAPKQLRKQLELQGVKVIEIKPHDKFVELKIQEASGQIRKTKWSPDKLALTIAGYNPDNSHAVYISYTPGEIQEKRNSNVKKKEYGASWTGQIDVVARIVLGRDPRTIELLTMSGLLSPQAPGKNVQKTFAGLEYAIGWGTMTLQDALDFARLMIETTSAIQKFSDGILMNPGGIPGVGGPIDSAVITPDKGFAWVSKKTLKLEEGEIDLDRLPNLANQGHKKSKGVASSTGTRKSKKQ